MAAAAGVVGASIEDASNGKESKLYELSHAVERVAAAAEAAASLPFKLTLTARAENFVRGNPDLDDTIERLLAYEKAGADVLFAPGLPDLAAVRKVCSAVSKPVNFAVAIRGKAHSVAELADAGVKRISFAASLSRVAMTGFVEAVREISGKGRFTYLDRMMTTPDFNRFLPD